MRASEVGRAKLARYVRRLTSWLSMEVIIHARRASGSEKFARMCVAVAYRGAALLRVCISPRRCESPDIDLSSSSRSCILRVSRICTVSTGGGQDFLIRSFHVHDEFYPLFVYRYEEICSKISLYYSQLRKRLEIRNLIPLIIQKTKH